MQKVLLLLFLAFINSGYAQWQQMPGPDASTAVLSGKINCFASNDTLIWAGTDGSGIFVKNVQGLSPWQAKNTGLKSFTIFSLHYAAGSLVATTTQGVYRSDDGGNTWQAINKGLPLGPSITSFGANSAVYMAGTANFGVFISNDKGQNWQKANNGLLDNNVLKIVTTSTQSLALTANGGIFKTADNGQNWQQINIPGGCSLCSDITLVDNTLIVANDHLIISFDNGSHWQEDTSLHNIKGISAHNGLLLAWGNHRLYNSFDTGKTWHIDDYEFYARPDQVINTAVPLKTDLKYAGTLRHGAFIGVIAAIDWKPACFGLLTGNVKYIEAHNNKLFAVAYSQIYTSADHGQTWLNVSLDPEQEITAFVFSGNKLFYSTDSNGIFMSTNNGQDWQAANNGLSDLLAYKVLKQGNSLFALVSTGIYRSSDDGQSWQKYCNNIDTLKFTDILFDGSLLYAGTNYGFFKSTDDGQNFVPVSDAEIPRRYVYYIQKIDGKIYTKIGIDTYISLGGNSWPRYYFDMGVPLFSNGMSLIGSQLYTSTNGGNLIKNLSDSKWSFLNTVEGLVSNIFVRDDLFLYAGTTAGIWRLPLVQAVTGINNLAYENLFIVYPNPATDKLNIEAGNGFEKAIVYSISGKMILESYYREIDISNLVQGLYFIELHSNGKVFRSKFIIEK